MSTQSPGSLKVHLTIISYDDIFSPSITPFKERWAFIARLKFHTDTKLLNLAGRIVGTS